MFITAAAIESDFRAGDPKKWMPWNLLFKEAAAPEHAGGPGGKARSGRGKTSAAGRARAVP